MMRTLSHDECLAFSHQWCWIASDRIGELDSFLRRPIRRLERLRDHTKNYLESIRAIPDLAPDTLAADAFRNMLDRLRSDGEDVDRILGWCETLTDTVQFGEDLGSFVVWKDTLRRWSLGRRSRAKHAEEALLARIINTYLKEAFEPSVIFDKTWQASKEAWLSNSRRRSSWDQFLWNNYFRDMYIDPAVFPEYDSMLTREWWRRLSPKLSYAEKEKLMDEHVENIQSFGDPQTMNWSLIRPIDSAMALDVIPPFDQVAAT